mmetsp:Transcript_3108/g.6612  ORF Transcript_3108/g.6612 Transcript_3108/m.6612 type:complete len:278 (-) Transcript_3108:1168-2001(-)
MEGWRRSPCANRKHSSSGAHVWLHRWRLRHHERAPSEHRRVNLRLPLDGPARVERGNRLAGGGGAQPLSPRAVRHGEVRGGAHGFHGHHPRLLRCGRDPGGGRRSAASGGPNRRVGVPHRGRRHGELRGVGGAEGAQRAHRRGRQPVHHPAGEPERHGELPRERQPPGGGRACRPVGLEDSGGVGRLHRGFRAGPWAHESVREPPALARVSAGSPQLELPVAGRVFHLWRRVPFLRARRQGAQSGRRDRHEPRPLRGHPLRHDPGPPRGSVRGPQPI